MGLVFDAFCVIVHFGLVLLTCHALLLREVQIIESSTDVDLLFQRTWNIQLLDQLFEVRRFELE